MNQSFYIGAVGAQQQQSSLNVQGNNIANVNTYGYKAQKSRFSALMYQNMQGIDGAELPSGTGARMLMTSTDFAPGAVASTGRSLDYMIEGEGFFGLADLQTGEVTFTRNGAFTIAELQRDSGEVDENGQPVLESVWYLSDGDGRFVVSDRGGLIEVEDESAVQPIGIFDYINYDGMEHLGGTRFLPVDKNGNLAIGTGTLHQGMLELSNVDLAEEITKVIESQRMYSMALKIVQTSDEIETTVNGLRT